MATERRQVMDGGAVVIPADFRRELGVEPGDQVEFENRGGEITLRRAEGGSERDDRGSDRNERAGGDDDTKYPPNKVQGHLKGVSYPASKQDLVDQAKKNDAPDVVMNILERMPDEEYGGPQDVMKAASFDPEKD